MVATSTHAARSRDDTLIVGPGRVGSTLARALALAGWPVVALAGRRVEACRRLAESLGPGVRWGSLDELDGPYPLVLLAVSDDAIGAVADRLAALGVLDRRAVVLHVSGALGSDVLGAAAAAGAATGSMHPLQTFPDVEAGLRALPGSHWFVEGDARALDAAGRLVKRLHGTPHVIATADKVLYHAAAVIACNYLTVLMDAALKTAERAGIERGPMFEALYPLLVSTLDNLATKGAAASLTGPVSRGDVDTVRRHVGALDRVAGAGELYRLLGLKAVALAREGGRIDDDAARSLAAVLAAQEDHAGER